MEPGGSISNNLVDKIRNIDGKIIKEGKLRSAMRGVVKVGSYVESLDGSLHAKDSGLPTNKTMPPINDGVASESFGEHSRLCLCSLRIIWLFGAAVAIPMVAVEEVSSRFSNTLYGYFIGKRLAFPLVENYVKNTWAKFGLKRTQLHEDFFMFQFNTKEGMESVMESGPWLVRGVPLILNIWNQNSELKKDAIKSAPLWVKLHHVPIVAYSEIGLSLITTQLAEEELKDSIVIAIPLSNGKGHTLAKIEVEYEWNPPRCNTCKVFDHVNDKCPKNPKVDAPTKAVNDGFTVVTKRKLKPNQKNKQVEGVRLSKPALNLQYRRVDKTDSSRINEKNHLEPLNDVEKREIFGIYSYEIVIVKKLMRRWCLTIAMVKRLLLREQALPLVRFPMINVASWNIRGLNFTPKQNEVRQVISENNLSVFAILESHVVKSKLMKMCSLLFFSSWVFSDMGIGTSNGAWCSKGIELFLAGITMRFHAKLHLCESTGVTRVLTLPMREFKKAKISWLKDGDSNTAYFHKSVKSRVSRSRIDVISNSDGIIFANDKVPDAFVAHYEAFLGQTEAMFSMGDEKSPGPDGFSAAFFKEAWHIVGVDVINAIREFFTNGKLLKELNHTIIALIPKGKGVFVKVIRCPLIFSIWSMEFLTLRFKRMVGLDCFFSIVRSKGKAKVAWELVCLPKDEGGLGIRRLEHFNSALLVSHIWNLLSLKESLWVKWVHVYKLNGRNFWDVPIRG
ncbi:zinc knuckle CX2CX4HX4C containing protein [Tanacetum coccineum]